MSSTKQNQKASFGYLTHSGATEFQRNALIAQIKSYCASRGLAEPHAILSDFNADVPLGKREYGSTLRTRMHPGEALIVPSFHMLCGWPSDIDDVLSWALSKGIQIHCIDLGGEISPVIPVIRVFADAFRHLEQRIPAMEARLAAQAEDHDRLLNEVIAMAMRRLTEKFLGLRETVEEIKEEAAERVADPVLAERRARAAELLQSMNLASA